jgi:hypothetical protein
MILKNIMNFTNKDLITYQVELQNIQLKKIVSEKIRTKVNFSLNQQSFSSRMLDTFFEEPELDEALKKIQEIVNERKVFIEKIIKKPLIY